LTKSDITVQSEGECGNSDNEEDDDDEDEDDDGLFFFLKTSFLSQNNWNKIL